VCVCVFTWIHLAKTTWQYTYTGHPVGLLLFTVHLLVGRKIYSHITILIKIKNTHTHTHTHNKCSSLHNRYLTKQ